MKQFSQLSKTIKVCSYPSVCTYNSKTASPSILLALFSTSSVTPSTEAPLLPGLSPEQIRKIGENDKMLRDRHLVIEGNMPANERDVARRKRMIYRSKQRGWLEADLLLGSWAKENVPTLNDSELDEVELILKEETIDVYNYISGKDPLPPHLVNLSTMKKIQAYAMEKTMSTPEGYEITKRKNNLI